MQRRTSTRSSKSPSWRKVKKTPKRIQAGTAALGTPEVDYTIVLAQNFSETPTAHEAAEIGRFLRPRVLMGFGSTNRVRYAGSCRRVKFRESDTKHLLHTVQYKSADLYCGVCLWGLAQRIAFERPEVADE